MVKIIQLSEKLVHEATLHGDKFSRTASQQIELWAIIGKIAEQNPELRFEFIQEIFIGLEQTRNGKTSEYEL